MSGVSNARCGLQAAACYPARWRRSHSRRAADHGTARTTAGAMLREYETSRNVGGVLDTGASDRVAHDPTWSEGRQYVNVAILRLSPEPDNMSETFDRLWWGE